MPELPEVETIVRGLRDAVVGRRVQSVALGHTGVLRFPKPHVFVAAITGRTMTEVARRGKYVVIALDGGEDLVLHLGMTGHLLVTPPDAIVAKHTHLRAALDDVTELRFDDARRFGRIMLGQPAELRSNRALPALGVEPLSAEFTSEYVDSVLRTTTRPVKAVLLDQTRIAGLGNIYADEACHLAGVRPARRAHRLSRPQRERLREAIQTVLHKAIGNRGTTFDDYRDVWNGRGDHQEQLQVYGRAALHCYACGGVLRRTVVAGRTTVYCPTCQR